MVPTYMALKVPKPAAQTVERMSGTRCDNSTSDSTRIYAIPSCSIPDSFLSKVSNYFKLSFRTFQRLPYSKYELQYSILSLYREEKYTKK